MPDGPTIEIASPCSSVSETPARIGKGPRGVAYDFEMLSARSNLIHSHYACALATENRQRLLRHLLDFIVRPHARMSLACQLGTQLRIANEREQSLGEALGIFRLYQNSAPGPT